MLFKSPLLPQSPTRAAITAAYRQDETLCIENLLAQLPYSEAALKQISVTANKLVLAARLERKKQGGINSMLQQYDLSSEEGIALMCLAEALLRIPDQHTRDLLVSDKISAVNWLTQNQKNKSLFTNAANWSLMLTGKVFAKTPEKEKSLFSTLKRSLLSPGMLAIRPIILQGMKLIGNYFVTGQTIDEALKNAKALEKEGYRYSYDMLGEAARTARDAGVYYQAYEDAIKAIGESAKKHDPVTSPGISIKLSALHPRYEFAKKDRVMAELMPELMNLINLAKNFNIGVTIDAEEADRLDLSLDIFEAVMGALDGPWEGLGIVVQAYQKRAPYVIDWLAQLCQSHDRRIMVRLVKGAYWDAEIKQAQVAGLDGYPVFTRKNSTDVSYLACAKKLLDNTQHFYPQFGTHNAHSVAAIMAMSQVVGKPDFEFQCLHGMGQPLYNQIVAKDGYNIPCRIYAPVGSHKELVGYLVRRLLENGANSSFIKVMADESIPVETIIAHPTAKVAAFATKPHPYIPLPRNIYAERLNSAGVDLANFNSLADLQKALATAAGETYVAGPLINGSLIKTKVNLKSYSPTQPKHSVGEVSHAGDVEIEAALMAAVAGQSEWARTPVLARAAFLDEAAKALEAAMPRFIYLLCQEAGKAIPDCISEIREAIDFCRYYAAQAREIFMPQKLQGVTGELNLLSLHPRGVLACISPWNFPLAIFMGQITAALACGNTVIAKPAEQTPLVAFAAVQLLHAAGIPETALHLLPGEGGVVGARLSADARVDGLIFTGSTATAQIINRTLAQRSGPIVPLIAETGGQNAMLVDSSALPEQAVADIVLSAFNSAGQRCSALRVLFVQAEIAEPFIEMLKGAMAELALNDPSLLSTDVGPVIDAEALGMLNAHVTKMRSEAKILYQAGLPTDLKGSFCAPTLIELQDLSQLKGEVFGPILHVISYASGDLDKVLDSIIQTGYGLTLGVHSRIESTIQYIIEKMPVGNVYINRNMVGAVVGVQPFGGERLSGTGPKAGGPHYLQRLCVERSLSTNTTAVGGNTTLVTLHEEV